MRKAWSKSSDLIGFRSDRPNDEHEDAAGLQPRPSSTQTNIQYIVPLGARVTMFAFIENGLQSVFEGVVEKRLLNGVALVGIV